MVYPSVAAVIIVRNEEFFLKQLLPRVVPYVDQTIVVDMMSTDSSRQIYSSVLSGNSRVIDYNPQDLFRHGFAHPRNIGAEQVETEWIFSIDADEVLLGNDTNIIRKSIAAAKCSVLSIKRYNLRPGELSFTDDLSRLVDTCERTEEGHRRIYRREEGIRWEGFIHEEIWSGERSAFFNHEKTEIPLWHFSLFRRGERPKEKREMYAWMLLQASLDSRLQFGTNDGWYKRIVPQQLDELVVYGNRFAEAHDLRSFHRNDFGHLNIKRD